MPRPLSTSTWGERSERVRGGGPTVSSVFWKPTWVRGCIGRSGVWPFACFESKHWAFMAKSESEACTSTPVPCPPDPMTRHGRHRRRMRRCGFDWRLPVTYIWCQEGVAGGWRRMASGFGGDLLRRIVSNPPNFAFVWTCTGSRLSVNRFLWDTKPSGPFPQLLQGRWGHCGWVGFGIVNDCVGICSQHALGCKHSFAIFAPPIVG